MNIVAIPAAAPANPEPEGRAENRAGESLVAQSTLDTTPPIVRMPVDGRVALAIVATVVLIFALEWAQTFFVSLLLGILFAYTLNPLVVWLELIKIPRMLGTGIVLAAVVCALVLGSYSLRGQMERIVKQLPAATSKFSAGLASIRGDHLGNMQKVETAAREIEKAASQGADSPSTPKQPATHVVIDHPSFKPGNFLWVGSMGAVGVIGEAIMVLFLVFFLLLGGDTFKRKLVRITGPSLSNKKITVHILDDINDSIQKYMFMLLTTNVLVGLLSWIAFRWIGLENAGAWAVAAGLLHVMGPGLTAVATGMAAFIQFDSFSTTLLVSGASLAIATLVGTFVVTWMTGKIAKMNAAAVFISLLFWGWLWGVWGMLLSVPIIVIVKVVSERVEELEPVAELLGE